MNQPAAARKSGAPPRRTGFTLIELLITLAVVAILSAIAWPGYGAVIRRAQRQDARLALLDLQHAQERHYLRHFSYTDRLEGTRADGGLGLGGLSPQGEYRLAVEVDADGQGYLARAVPLARGRQAQDHQCASFSVDETGRRTAADSAGGDTTTTCWP